MQIYIPSIIALLLSTHAFGATPDSKITHRKPAVKFGVLHSKPPLPAITPSKVPEGFKMFVPEWAESESVMLSWADKEFVSAFTRKTKVTSFADSKVEIKWWKAWLKKNNIPKANRFEILEIPTDSIFPRDYGPEFIFRNRNLEMVDFEYYSSRRDDDRLPYALAKKLGLEIHTIGLYSEGGNLMGDGLARGYSSTWLNDENKSLSPDDILLRLVDFLGFKKTWVFPFVEEPDSWTHIDTFAKLVSHDTWIVAEFPEGSAFKAGVDKFLEELKTKKAAHGGPFKVFRMPMVLKPGTNPSVGEDSYRGYLNSLIHNQFLFMAVYGDEKDEQAMNIYRQAMPGYEVVPVLAPTTYWGDAIHCRSRNIPKRESLYLHPMTFSTSAGVELSVYAYAYWPIHKQLDDVAQIHWQVNGGAWESRSMERMGEAFYTELPAQPAGTQIHYYLEAGLVGEPKARFPKFAPLKTYDLLIE